MKKTIGNGVALRLLENLPLVLLVVVFAAFSLLDARFFAPETLLNIGRQASYVGVLAVGMTWLRITPFIVTLATMGIFRGIAIDRSGSREANYPSALTELGNERVLGIPLPILIFAVVVLVSHIVLTRTAYGRQLYAVGQDPVAAERAGIPTKRILWSVYAICGALAGLAAFVAVIQLGTVVPSFGVEDEFDAIAAAVLGGASLFGGRGSVFPGTVAGTLLVQMISVGLVFTQVDLYLTPMVSAVVILLAVLLDTLRTRLLTRLAKRSIRNEANDRVVVPVPGSAPGLRNALWPKGPTYGSWDDTVTTSRLPRAALANVLICSCVI